MTKYKISMTLTAEEFMAMFPHISGSVSLEIKQIESGPTGLKPQSKPKAPKFPRLRKSKVNDAILSAMNGGPATIKALKSALEGAGMSASSLSTGLSILTKSGQIERVGDGEYALKAA